MSINQLFTPNSYTLFDKYGEIIGGGTSSIPAVSQVSFMFFFSLVISTWNFTGSVRVAQQFSLSESLVINE